MVRGSTMVVDIIDRVLLHLSHPLLVLLLGNKNDNINSFDSLRELVPFTGIKDILILLKLRRINYIVISFYLVNKDISQLHDSPAASVLAYEKIGFRLLSFG